MRCDQVRPQQKNVSERVSCFWRRPHLAAAHQPFERVLQVLLIRMRLLVDNHQVDRQQLHPPVLVRAQELPDDFDVVGFIDERHHDRPIA